MQLNIIIKSVLYLILRLIFILFIYQLLRLGYYYYNYEYFTEIDIYSYYRIIKGSLKFDISAILYINLLVIFLSLLPSNLVFKKGYQKFIKSLFIYCNIIGISVNIIDMFYYPYVKNRMTFSFFKEFSQSGLIQNKNSVFQFILDFGTDYWLTIPLVFIMLYVTSYFAAKTTLNIKSLRFNIKYIILSSIIAILMYTLTVFGLRGSFIYKNRPITISNAGKYATKNSQIPLIINTPFSLIRTAHIKDISKKEYYNKQELDQYYDANKYFRSNQINKKNIVIIILESMATEYYGIYNNTEITYTPFLDSLISKSFTSENTFSNGVKSIDAMPAILASIPSTNFHFSLSKYSTNNIQGLGNLLENIGYSTSFFHGAPNGSMGFESMANICGIDNFYGMDNYNNKNDYDGLWGIWDDKFFTFFAEKLNRHKEPFFSSIFTCSSHHPYKLPIEYQNKFIKGEHPMHECVQYTDYALKKFFNKVKEEEWYNNTLFVITADHTNISMKEKYKNSLGIFRVPIIFFDPNNNSLAKRSKIIIQHTDIMPSILGYINYNKPIIAFGNNIFKDSLSNFAINYHNGYQLIIDEKLIIYNENSNEIQYIYDFINDPLLKKNILKEITPLKSKYYKNKIRAFIQNYDNRMINNNLIYES